MKVIGLGGLPAVGKSTIFKGIRKTLGNRKIFKYGILKGEYYDPNIYILGTYDRKFGGTDTLSMAVQPNTELFLKSMKNKDIVIMFEGDRLFNGKFIKFIKAMKINYSLYMIIANPDIIEKRHIQRNDTQSEQWKKSRDTKYSTIYRNYVKDITLLTNDNNKQLKENVKTIWQDLKNIK